jgi:hypothetical protein
VGLTPSPPSRDLVPPVTSPGGLAQANTAVVQETLSQPFSCPRRPRVTPGVASLSLICQALISVQPCRPALPNSTIPFPGNLLRMKPCPSVENTASNTHSSVPSPHAAKGLPVLLDSQCQYDCQASADNCLGDCTSSQLTRAVDPAPIKSRMELPSVVAVFCNPNTDPSQEATPHWSEDGVLPVVGVYSQMIDLFNPSTQRALRDHRKPDPVRYGDNGLNGAPRPLTLIPQEALRPMTHIPCGAQSPMTCTTQESLWPMTHLPCGAQSPVTCIPQEALLPMTHLPCGAQSPVTCVPQEVLPPMTHIPPGILQASVQMLDITMEDAEEVTCASAQRLYFPGN